MSRGRSTTHPLAGRSESGGRRGEDFLVSRVMGFSPGEESLFRVVAAQAIEAQPVFGQIRPSRGQVRSCREQHPQEKRWRISVTAHKRSASSGVEKEVIA